MKKKYKGIEKAAAKFTSLMIERIKEISHDWTKPWIPVRRKNFYPRNISGRRYSGGNTIMLLIHMIFCPYRTPVFLTYNQAEELGLRVKPGAFPVYHFTYMYLHRDTRQKISEKEYDKLTENEQEQYISFPTARYYNVFNLDLTDYEEKYPEQWAELLDHYREKVKLNEGELFNFPLLDTIIEEGRWVCPIKLQVSNRAYYSTGDDEIRLPLKQQFHTGESFYGTMLHEMTHSTGIESRLKRKMGHRGSPEYAREELVAELSSALLGYFMEIETSVSRENAAYLKYWTGQLDAQPDFLMDVLGDVVKAVNFTMAKVGFELPEEISITSQAKAEKKDKPQVTVPVMENEEVMVID